MKSFNVMMTVNYDETQTEPEPLVNSLEDILNTHGDSIYSVEDLEIQDKD